MSEASRISVTCPTCGKVVKAPPEFAGKRVRCSHKPCTGIVQIPDEPTPDDSPAPVPEAAPPRRKRASQEPRDEPRPRASRSLLPWFVVAGLLIALGIESMVLLTARSETESTRALLAESEQQAKAAVAAKENLAGRVAAAEQKHLDSEMALDTMRRSNATLGKDLMEGKKVWDEATAVNEKLRKERAAAEQKADAAEKRLAAAEKKGKEDPRDAEIQTLKKDLKAAQLKFDGREAEIAKLKKDLAEAEKYGPFQAFAGKWESTEMLGKDFAVVSISIKGNGECWTSTVTPAGQGVGNFQFKGAKLIAKDGKYLLDDQLLNKNWALAVTADGKTITMTEVGGGGKIYTLVREKAPAVPKK